MSTNLLPLWLASPSDVANVIPVHRLTKECRACAATAVQHGRKKPLGHGQLSSETFTSATWRKVLRCVDSTTPIPTALVGWWEIQMTYGDREFHKIPWMDTGFARVLDWFKSLIWYSVSLGGDLLNLRFASKTNHEVYQSMANDEVAPSMTPAQTQRITMDSLSSNIRFCGSHMAKRVGSSSFIIENNIYLSDRTRWHTVVPVKPSKCSLVVPYKSWQ